MPALAANTTIGSYRLLRRLGAGGMGEVWQAEHSMIGRRAAIKVLHDTYANQPEIVQRFFNEARAATAIADPGIVQVFDFGQSEGMAYLVMELLDGETLDHRLSRGALAVPDALRIVRQVATSLGAAHAAHIVHRDLKPENIFIVRDPEAIGGERTKILDFGIAKLAGDAAGVKTQTSIVMGSPHYMSPEQCRDASLVDRRSDIYALGCVLFVALAGRPPFQAAYAGELIAQHLHAEPPRLRSVMPGMHPDVEAPVARCLAKDPAERFSSGTALAAALATLSSRPEIVDVRSQETLTTGTPAPVDEPRPTTMGAAAAEAIGPAPSARGRSVAKLGLALGCIAVLAIVAFVVMRREPGPALQPALAPIDAAPALALPPTDAPVPTPIETPIEPIVAAPAPVAVPEPPPPQKKPAQRRVTRTSSTPKTVVKPTPASPAPPLPAPSSDSSNDIPTRRW